MREEWILLAGRIGSGKPHLLDCSFGREKEIQRRRYPPGSG